METYIRKHMFDAIHINTRLPKAEQPAEVLAQTVMDAIFDGLISNQISTSLLSIYNRCASRHDMDTVKDDYIARYARLNDADPLKAHPAP